MMDPSITAKYAELEREHWWLLGRREIVRSQVERRFGGLEGLRVLEIGCGSGENLRALGAGCATLGVEPDPGLREIGIDRGTRVLAGALPRDLPQGMGAFDVVMLLDVLEHVEDDAAALRACAELVTSRGAVLITVPAAPWLWSRHDVYAGHKRRYRARSLRDAARRAVLAVERLSHYNCLLFAPFVAARLVDKLCRRAGGPPDFTPPAKPVNSALRACLVFESRLLARVNLPWGGSLLAWLKPG